jgi:Bacterial capsule synthesis protein PGA_cap
VEAFVSQQDILNLAKEGDAKAIAFLIGQALQSFGVTAKASSESDSLHLLLEAEQLPAEDACIRVVVKGLQRLQPNNVSSLTIYGRKIGQQLPAWTQRVELKKPLTSEPASAPVASIPTPSQTVENKQKSPSSIELISAAMLKNGQDARSTTQQVAGGTVILPVAEVATAHQVASGTVILPGVESHTPHQVADGTGVLPLPQQVIENEAKYQIASKIQEKSQPKPAAIPTPKPTNKRPPQQPKSARKKTQKSWLSVGTLSLILVPISGLVLGSQLYKSSSNTANQPQTAKPATQKVRAAQLSRRESNSSSAPASQPLADPKSPSQAAQTPANLPATVSIKAVGDIIPGTNFPYNKLPENKDILFKSVKPYLQGSDILFGNFESTMTDYPYSSKGNGGGMLFAFRTPPSYAKILKDVGFDVLSVANNHSYDFHEQGFKDTIKNIDSNGMKAVGKRDQIVYKNVKGVNFAFIGFSNYGEVHNSLLELKAGAEIVKKAKQKADIVVISVHAGAEGTGAINVRNKTEFFYGENRGNMVLFSRTMIDAGADLILGHGPHVMRALELYKGKLIAYSLGNFMGYRTLSTAGELGQSLILDVKMNPQGDFVSGKIIPVELNSRGIPFIDDDFSSVGLMRSLTKSDFPNTGLKIDDKGQILKKSK